MGRLLRKELLRVTIIQKVNENKKKAPQLERSCSAFLYISILFVYLLLNSNLKNIPIKVNIANIIIPVVKVSPVIILSNTVSNIIIFSPIF